MLKRPFKSLIARIAIVALALSLVVPFVPAAFAQDTSFDYAENGTGPVATFTATDADGDAIVWSLSGADADLFTIEGGVLAFKKSPNYESRGDEGSDNTYNVTLNASGGSRDVSVTVTNVDEMGSVSLTDLQPQAGESVTASVSDQDSSGLDQVRWQWSKSMEEDGSGEDISGATSPTYTPKTGDIGYYLQATATYSDGLGTGRDSASAVTAFAVEERPVANSQPAFADDDADMPDAQQTRPVRETAKAGDSVGNAVTASDSDNDPLLYSMDGILVDLAGIGDVTGVTGVDSDDLFTIDKISGQISVKSGANTDYFDRESYTSDTGVLNYTVTVTAEDPSGSQGTVTVTIEVTEVNEAATIAVADDALDADVTITRTGDEFVVTTPEEAALALTGDPGGTNVFEDGLPVFDAYDPEEAAEGRITWSISGPDAKRFEIRKVDANDDNTTDAAEGDNTSLLRVDSSAALRWSSDDRDGPSFEDMDSADGDNVYLVTVTVFDGVASKSQAVSVTVNNVEETGTVSLTQRVPQEGRAITARLSDPDGGVTGAEWQWYRGAVDLENLPDTECDANTADGAACLIADATSSTYTPTADDAGAGNTLTVVVTYTDAFVTDDDAPAGDDGDTANATSDGDAVERPDENALPTFGDDESVDRSVEENASGANVGEPVTATDSDSGDQLMYAISDTTNFKVNNDGQITTAKALDFETQSSYTVMVTATDPSGASASITVNVTVTDADDPATISATSSVSYAENGTGPVATFTATDADGDAIVWSLSGADAEDFTIEGGVLAFKSSPNYESPGDEGSDNTYNVAVRASGGSTDVAVTVTNVDETGSVSLTDLQPQAGESVTATVSDQDSDSLDQVRWQWSKSMDQEAWSDISGASSPTYTPKTGDIGYYLQATATYSDGLGTGRDSASGVTALAVEERPVANARPAFADDDSEADGAQQTRPVRETAKAGDSVGNAVTASDSDNDPLLYTLDGGEAVTLTGGTAPSVDADDLFTIDRLSGQISVKSGATTDYFDRETYTTPALTDVELGYVVTVTAEDPSGSQGTVMVTIEVTEVNEAATIAVANLALPSDVTITRTGDEFVVTTPEEAALALTGDPGGTNVFEDGLPVFDADDPEDADVAGITWSISGPDAKRFEIRKVTANNANNGLADVDSSAALRWSSADRDGPSFEDMDSADGDNVYQVTVTVFDGVASKSQDVSVTVNNVEETGTVSLTQRVPQEGRAITARLSDPDGGVTGAEWQWYRAVDDGDPLPDTTDDTVMCDAETADGTACWIADATSSTYTPTADDAGDGNTLTVVVTYTDAYVTDADGTPAGDDGDTARATSDGDAVERPDQNAQPTFGDDESVDRSVEENAKGANVGEPVTATDSDSGDRLSYTLSGDGSDAFKVNNDGQITTAEELDFETQSSYSVTLTATDPSGADASIVVNITVTDADDGATIKVSTENSAPAFADESVTLSVDENTGAGTAVGDPITATDKDGQELTYSLNDSSVVEIWPSGQLTVAEGANLDYEGDANSYTVVITASDGVDSASIMVTINVNNVGLDSPYDVDDNGSISKDEAITAVDDYFLDNITREEVNAVLAIYFG